MGNEQLKQMAEYRRQLRLNTLQNLMGNKNTPTQQNLNLPNIENAPKRAGFVESFTETNIDLLGHVAKGLTSFLEGGYDLLPSIIGSVGGWFSDDFEKKVKDHVAYDFSDDVFSWLNEATDDSYLNKMGEKGQTIVRGVHEAVGAMLPSVIAAIATSGASTPQLVAQAASLGTMFVGAAGQSTEEAVKEGADLGKATMYGIASGAAEAALEKVGGYVPWDDIAKTGGKVFGKEIAKSALGKAAVTFASEGAEEVASDILNPALKRITGVDKNAKLDLAQLPETFVIGGLAGVTMGGVNRIAANLRYSKEGGSQFLNMADEMASIRENEEKLASYQQNKKHTADQVADFSKRVDTDNYESIQRISKTLKSLPANKRGNAFLTAPELHNMFDTNGEIKADIKRNFESVSNMNVSAGIRHQTENLNNVLKDVNARNKTKFELDTDALNETERTTFAKVTNAVSRLAESSKYKAFAGLDVAIIKNAKNENAFIKDGVIYLSREHLSSGEWAKHVAHEVTHFTEGSKEYNDFASFLTEDTEAVNRAADAIASQGYGFTADDVKHVLRKVQSGEKLNAKETEAYSELVSHIAEEILGNEDSINRLTAKNKSLANRIYERIKSFIKAFRGTNADKATMQRLRKAEQLFAKALENAGKEKANQLYNQAVKTLKTAPQFSKIVPVVEISISANLAKLLSESKENSIAIIQNYIWDKYKDYTFKLSDGKKATIDHKDANHLALNASEFKQAQASNLRDLVEKASLFTTVENVEHRKFSDFSYYVIQAKFGGEIYNLAINVGKTRNDGTWRLYDINSPNKIFKQIKKELPAEQLSVFEGFESFFIKNSSLTTSNITQEAEDVNTKLQKNQKNISEAEQKELENVGIVLNEGRKEAFSLKYSTLENPNFNERKLAEIVAEGTGRSYEDSLRWVRAETSVAKIVAENPEFLNYEADERYTAIKSNSDYPQGTVDLSNLCRKREEFTAMFDKLQRKYPNKLFTALDIADIRKILKNNGITVACGLCFVDDRRQLTGEVAETYINMWKTAVAKNKPLTKTNSAGKEIVLKVTEDAAKEFNLQKGEEILPKDKYIPNQYDLTTYEGFAKLTKEHPSIAMGFTIYNNSRGQQAARLIEGRAEYDRQILSWSKDKVEKVNNVGGLRIFSYSDFEVVHLLDLVQVIIDCAAKGVKIQGYTKVPEFARLVKGTGIKLNRSLIPKGKLGFSEVNGKKVLEYDTIEGIDINSKNFIDDPNDPDIGNILVGINDEQIRLAMKDEFVDYIIPFHSNKTKEANDKLGLSGWNNYKNSQHDKNATTGKSAPHNINIYTEVIQKYNPQNKVDFVNAFLKECKEQDIIPRYEQFLDRINGEYVYTEGYHKFLVDFKLFDKKGNILPQGFVTPNLDAAYMKELLESEIDKKKSYQFPQAVFDEIETQFGDSERFSRKKKSTPQEQTNVRLSVPQQQQTTKQKIVTSATDTWLNAQIHFTDEQAGIIKEAKRLGVKDMDAMVNFVRASYNAAQSMLENSQRNIKGEKVGKSFTQIWDPVYKKGDEYRKDFYMYLMNYHNIDRIAVDKDLIANTTAADSRKEIARLKNLHPEFEEMAKDVWNYNRNLMQLRVDMGLETAERAEYMNKMYPHYVPAFRAEEGNNGVGGLSGKYNVAVKQTIKTAKGSTKDILPPDVIIARQTMELMRAGRVNMLANELYEAALNSNDFTNVSVVEIQQRWQPNRTNKQLKLDRQEANEILEMMDEDYLEKEKKPNQITFYRGKKKITIAVTPDIYVGFESFTPNTEYRNKLLNLVTGGNNVFKKLVTSANPFFLVRNFFRDLQDAAFYTKHGARLAPAIAKAYKEIATNGEMWQKYLAAGGLSAGMFDYNTGIKRYTGAKAVYNKVIGKLEWANMIVEQAPRLAEFTLSMNKGASIEQALLDSAEVTTNFSRGGKFAKFLNRTVMPFLNPSIQGWSKLYRTVTGRKSARLWMELILKCLILGILPTALNDLLNDDDEEYESLNIRDKENYYLFKIGDTFLKLPKGRVLSVFGSLYIRGKESVKGNENAWDGYLQSVSSAVSPIDSFTRTIFSPLTDAATNTTWYGGEIEGRRLQNLAPEDRYDESTSSVAIFLGRTFNYSPKKIHYVIDQYSGVIGDVLLPLTTTKAEKGLIASNFTIDPTLSNRYSNDFYTALDEATFAKNAGDINATYVTRYLNSVAGEVSDMYATKREIENSKKSDKDKKAEIKTVQALINATNKSALEGAKVLEKALKQINVEQQNKLLQQNRNFQKLDEAAQKKAIQKLNDYYYELAMSKAFGTELSSKYAKYSQFDTSLFVYLTEIADISSDKDRQGNAIAGSKKAKVIKYLRSKGVTGSKQEAILEILGYSNN